MTNNSTSPNILDDLWEHLNTKQQEVESKTKTPEQKRLDLVKALANQGADQPSSQPPIIPGTVLPQTIIPPQEAQTPQVQPPPQVQSPIIPPLGGQTLPTAQYPEIQDTQAKRAAAIAAQYHPINDPQYAPSKTRRILSDVGGTLAGILSRNFDTGEMVAEHLSHPGYYKNLRDIHAQQEAIKQPLEAEEKGNVSRASSFKTQTANTLRERQLDDANKRFDEGGPKRITRFELADGTPEDVIFDARQGTYTDKNGEPWIPPSDAHVVPNTGGMNIMRSVPGDVSSAAAIKLQKEQGTKYNDSDGKPIDLSKLGPDDILKRSFKGDKSFYTVVTAPQSATTVGGHVVEHNKFNLSDIGSDKPGTRDLGLATGALPRTTMPAGMVPDPNNPGQTILVPAERGVYAPGPNRQNQAPINPQNIPPDEAPQGGNIPPTPAPRNIHSNREVSTATPKPTVFNGPAAGGRVTVGQDTQYKKTARSIREFTTQLFGDKTNPGLKSLSTYGDLADKEDSRKKIGTAMSALFSFEEGLARGTESTGLNIHGGGSLGVGGVGIGGGVGKTSSSQHPEISTDYAAANNKPVQDALKVLSPREREYINAAFKSYESVAGLRSMTAAPSTQASLQQIQRNLPIIGINVTSRKDYKDRLVRFAQDGLNNVWGVPPNYLGDIEGTLREFVRNRGPNEFDPDDLKRNDPVEPVKRTK